MKTLDSRAKAGGFFPFQSHVPRWPIENRPSILGYRVVDRLDRTGQKGHWVYEDGTQGDLMGAFHWQQSGGGRPMGEWLFAAPAVITGAAKGSSVATDPRGGGGGGGSATVAIMGLNGAPDARMEKKVAIIPQIQGRVEPSANPVLVPGNPNVLFLGIGAGAGPGGRPVGLGVGFAQFQGVRTNFTNGNANVGGTFSGVRTNFLNGNSQVGGSFSGVRNNFSAGSPGAAFIGGSH